MKLRKKALLPAIAMVLASVIALSGVTYAWFTTGNTANVQALDVNVATASGIQVSLDAASWKSTIKAEDFVTAVSGNKVTIQYPMGDAEILPVSSAGQILRDDEGNSTGKMAMFYGMINKDGTLYSASEVEKNTTSEGNFVAFDLYFKSSTANQPLTLKMGDTASYVKGINLAERDENGEIKTTEIGTEKAVRVAFVLFDGATSSVTTARDNTSISDIKIWEPHSTSRANGVPEGTEDDKALSYLGFNQGFESCIVEDLATNGYASEVTTFDDEQDMLTLQPGINKMRVYIWLEGQDVDCVNDISFGDFRVNLFFSVPGEE